MAQAYTLKKSLGQHFLHDEYYCQKIVDEVDLSKNLLEVGPGAGAITKYFLKEKNNHFLAVEFDQEKVDYLLKQYPNAEGKILHQDFLKMEVPFPDSFHIVGNFPYNISGPILFKVLDWEEQVESVVGMFQKEVAQRVAAHEGNKQYGILSVLIQAFYDVQYLFDVPAGAFTPPPKVVSGVIKLTKTNNPYDISEKDKFRKLVKAAFGQRRKKLRNALSGMIDNKTLPKKFAEKRAEQLSVPEFVELFKLYYS